MNSLKYHAIRQLADRHLDLDLIQQATLKEMPEFVGMT